MSGAFVGRGLDRFARVLARHVDDGSVPGLVALLDRGGETHVETLGRLAIGGAPMRRDAIFRIASMTKPIVAAATMILIEECRLRLDDPVDDLLPELANRRVLRSLDAQLGDTMPAARAITPRDLFTLRMGLGHLMRPPGTYPIQAALAERDLLQGPPHPASFPDTDTWMRRVGELPLMHQPGERWMYDLGLDVLGVLVARAAGTSLGAFLRERLFDPLGMRDTGFSVAAEQLDRTTASYAPSAGGALALYDAPDGEWARPPKFEAAASGLVSTADDFLAFARMLLRGGRAADGTRLLSRASVELMTTDQLTPAQKAVSGLTLGDFDATGWGFGLGIVTRRVDVGGAVGSYGWPGGLGTVWSSSPRDDLTVILLTQRAWASPRLPAVAADALTTAWAALEE